VGRNSGPNLTVRRKIDCAKTHPDALPSVGHSLIIVKFSAPLEVDFKCVKTPVQITRMRGKAPSLMAARVGWIETLVLISPFVEKLLPQMGKIA